MLGVHPELEDELTTHTGKKGEPSPNRLDACVWALTDLMLNKPVAKGRKYSDGRHRGRR
jgi:phage terminase large subunit-like protein